jgi:hypothetical protein|nr:hypothetical protein [Kofleriaceae bacterium]
MTTLAIHVSELAIDRLLAGELAAGDAAALRDHAAACARCGGALDDALATQHAFADAPRLLVPRRRRAPVWLAGGAVAAAAVLALVLVWPSAAGEQTSAPGVAPGVSPTERVKGTAIVGFFVSHDGQVRRGAAREPVMPGDRVELVTTTQQPMWFAAISSDGSVYVEPTRVDAGRELALPTAIELDAQLHDEVVTGVFCGEPFDVHAPPATCTTDRFTLVKVPR